MSQAGKLAEGSPSIPSLETLTGDTGGAVPGSGSPVNIDILGDTGVTVTGDPGTSTLTIGLTGGGIAIDSIHPDSGTDPVVPDGNGEVSIVGAGSTTTVGGTNSLSIQLTGLTQYNVLVGAGTDTITKVAPSSTIGVPLVSAGAAADPAFGTAVVAGGGTGRVDATAYAPICGGTTAGGIQQSADTDFATSGYVLTSTGSSSLPTWQASSVGFPWSEVSGAVAADSNNGYFVTATCTSTLPASPSNGDEIAYIVDTADVLTIQANTGQVIRIGSGVSAATGTAASNAQGDSVTLVYRSTGTSWIARSVVGTFTLT